MFTRLTLVLVFVFRAAPPPAAAALPQESGGKTEGDTLRPVRGGAPGIFWNTYARRYIYPPSFDIPDTAGAVSYRFSVFSPVDSQSYPFMADSPREPLTPVWGNLPPGAVRLSVEALGPAIPGGKKLLAEKSFIKSPVFSPPAGGGTEDYAASGRLCLADLLRQPSVGFWADSGKPYPYYPLWVHPSKLMGGVVRGMSAYARLAVSPRESLRAIAAARGAAGFLLSLREPAGSPLQFWTPTFWAGVERDIHPVYAGEHMTLAPAEAGMAFLDLFDVTGETRYREAALQIARTYVSTQGEDGTWPQLLSGKDGRPVTAHRLIPVSVVEFFDVLESRYGDSEFAAARARAFGWILENPVKTFNWEAQFEDTRPRRAYRNLSHREAVRTAALLFRKESANPASVALAEEILKFAEDQFVVWDPSDAAIRGEWFRPGSRWSGNDPYFGNDWFVPCALEQYVFYTPIAGSAANFVEAFLAAYHATGKEEYRQKARSLASSIVAAQRFWGGREYPTHLRKVLPEPNWLNVSVTTALSLINHDRDLR